MRKRLNRILIVMHTWKRLVCNKKKINNKKILIVFHQVFGDAVVFQNALQEYPKLFTKEEGYEITLVGRPSVIAFMKDIMHVPSDIKIEVIDFKKFLEDYKYYNHIIKQYRNMAGTIIVPGTSLSAEIFSASSNSSRRIGLVRSVVLKKPYIMAFFARKAYTERVTPNKEDMMLQRHRLLLNYLGAKEYEAKLPTLLHKEQIIGEERYCVLCPGSSKREKCWPIERFAEIADYIIEKYKMRIHLCGGAEEKEYEKILFRHAKNINQIISHIGETSFSEWSSIVQHASLVLGNDSATMHLAVASRRKAICIAGVYDKFQFFPYKVDKLEKDEILPITICKDMPCEWCRTIGYDAGYGNGLCLKRIKNNQCSLCIDEIGVKEVKKQVDNLLAHEE